MTANHQPGIRQPGEPIAARTAVDPARSNASAAATGITVVRISPASCNTITITAPGKMRENSKEFPKVHRLHPV